MKWWVKSVIRVLQCVNIMDRAGLETMLMNYYRNIDKSQIQFDFLTHRFEEGAYDNEIKKMGGKIYHAPRLYPQNYPAYFRWMKKFFSEHPEYRIIHSHIDSMSYLPLLAAKKAGIPVRIAHSHNTEIQKDFKYLLKQYFRFKINSVCNYRLACGEIAGKHLFGNKSFKVIPNAIEAERFYFNMDMRKKKREELEVEDKVVIGHVGRFSYQKNHMYLIKIFKEFLEIHPESVLLLVGSGEKEAEVQKQLKQMGIENKVRFLGNRSDVNELYQAMDVFVMPSFFEGIPVVGIEAQFSGLPCIFSDKVPKEVEFNHNCKFIPLSEPVGKWAKYIWNSIKVDRDKKQNFSTSIYNIKNSSNLLSNYYRSIVVWTNDRIDKDGKQ